MCCVATALVVGCAPVEDAAPLEPLTLTVATYNLRHDENEWERRFPVIADEIVRLRPDVIGVQEIEIFAEQAQTLVDLVKERDGSLGYEFHEEKKSGVAGDLTGEGVGILSRHALTIRDRLDLSEGRVAARDRITVRGHVIDLYDTHLHDRGEDDAIRAEQAAAIDAWQRDNADGHVTFLTGDMNDTDDSAAIATFRDDGWLDTFVEVHGADTAAVGNTSPIVLADGTTEQNPTKRIDYVFVQADARVTIEASEIAWDVHDAAGLWASDHLGVITTVTIAGD
jgi:beta-glucosidase